MSAVHSAPDGFDKVGWRRMGLAMLAAWLLPAVLGAVLMGLQWALGTRDLGSMWLMAWALSVVMMASPLISWAGLALGAIPLALMMDRGWFGWLPALALGCLVGLILGFLIDNEFAAAFGAGMFAILRGVLGRLAPAAFEA